MHHLHPKAELEEVQSVMEFSEIIEKIYIDLENARLLLLKLLKGDRKLNFME